MPPYLLTWQMVLMWSLMYVLYLMDDNWTTGSLGVVCTSGRVFGPQSLAMADDLIVCNFFDEGESITKVGVFSLRSHCLGDLLLSASLSDCELSPLSYTLYIPPLPCFPYFFPWPLQLKLFISICLFSHSCLTHTAACLCCELWLDQFWVLSCAGGWETAAVVPHGEGELQGLHG